jgi:hypothetical protein
VESVNQELLEKLTARTGLSKNRIYTLIGDKVRTTHLPRRLAAIALASERGINPSRYATDEDLATIRAGTGGSARPTPVPAQPVAGRTRARPAPAAAPRRRTQRRTREVFIVHGRNEQITRDLKVVLRAMGLTPIDFAYALRRSRRGTPYIGDVLDTVLKKSQPVVVLMTPDDAARLQPTLRKPSDPAHESRLTGQARANVLFEAGMAFGRSPDNTVMVEVGKLRPFTDVSGRHAVRLDNFAASRLELAAMLENAGCAVDREGGDWLTVGDFRIRPGRAQRRQRSGS